MVYVEPAVLLNTGCLYTIYIVEITAHTFNLLHELSIYEAPFLACAATFVTIEQTTFSPDFAGATAVN